MSSPQVNQMPFRSEDGDPTFLPGMNSSADPSQLLVGTYARSMNTVNRGGIVQTRPGYRCKFAAPVGNLQGGSFFFPKQGSPVIVFGVEGLLYVSEFPYVDYRQIPGVEFVSFARQLFFKQVEQSVEIQPDGSLKFITPRNLLVIQDGGQTSPVVYDGTTATHQKGPGTIPLGGPMEWVGDRLWVARGANVYASDLANPLGFTEPQYITTVEAFILPGDVTAMSRTPSVEFPQLLVFTSSTTTLLQASIRDRSLWITTPNFQQILFPNIGCTSQRSVVAHYGLLWWWSLYGLTSFDAAVLSKQTSTLPHRDTEMADSKGRLSEDVSGIAMAAVENYLLASVPYCDLYNSHTWVMDNAAYQTINTMAPPVWNSFWTGTRPVCWLTGEVNDTSAVFYFSRDYDGNNRLWEAFTPDRLDDGCQITWYLETRGYFVGNPLGPKQFRFADIALGELLGTVDVAVFWAGTTRGKYKRILTKRIHATRGPIRASDVLTADEILFGLKKQSRVIRTQDAKTISPKETQTSCGVESPNAEFIDESFQLLIVVSGPGAIRWVQTFTDPQEGEKLSGRCEDDEEDFHEVRFDGAAEKNADFEKALAKLEEDDIIFRSTKTATLTAQGLSETAMGESQSTISQQTADLVADTIARRKASHELEAVLPAVVSRGAS